MYFDSNCSEVCSLSSNQQEVNIASDDGFPVGTVLWAYNSLISDIYASLGSMR